MSQSKMKKAIQMFLIIILSLPLMSGSEQEPQLRILNKLVKIIESQEVIETVITFQHHQDKNCTLKDWNSREIPILRTTELSSFEVRRFLSKYMLALVCIDGDFDNTLLNALAKILANLRQQRIILWTQRKPTKKFLADISEQASKFRFLQLLVVSMGHHSKGVLSFYRLHPFPSARFIKVKNNLTIKSHVFPDPIFNYKGLSAIVKIYHSDFTVPIKTNTGFFPIASGEDMEIVEFSRRYNLDLKLYNENVSDHFDIQLTPRFIREDDILAQSDFVKATSAASLLVVVPCSNDRSLKDFLRNLDLQTWLLYLLPVYGTFVVVESLVLVMTYRMTGQTFRLTNLNPLLNLRAFRAILGLPFPELHRTSLSLRQLSLAITIFGFIFSNCFSCKLSAILTKPLPRPQVTNFEELRASGLTTITDLYAHSFIENNIDPKFFNQVIPKFLIIKPVDRIKFILSLNDSYSYIIYSKNWPYYQKVLGSMGKINHCTSKDLIIVPNLPRMYVLQSNSIFKRMLSIFLAYVQEAGLTPYWNRGILQVLMRTLKLKDERNMVTGPNPLTLQQLKYLWHLLAIGYGIAIAAFLVEIFLRKLRAVRRQEPPV
ncbi:hypothetical protein KR038_001002 [Drosophila bunnanda]|nr:hypothetical protein KR038_001002 [Drosophila bunnanda]